MVAAQRVAGVLPRGLVCALDQPRGHHQHLQPRHPARARTPCLGPAGGLLAASFVRLDVQTSRLLDPNTPYVFVMNHQSMMDIPVAFAAIPRNLRFVAKKILRYVPFIGFYMRRTGMVLVDRHAKSAYQNLGRAVEQLRAGDCFLAYPEGTRSVDGSIHSFKRGPFVTAVQAGVAIVPIAVEGSGRALARGGFNVRPTTVRVVIGDPIPTAGLSEADVPALIRRVRSAMIGAHCAIGGAGGTEELVSELRLARS